MANDQSYAIAVAAVRRMLAAKEPMEDILTFLRAQGLSSIYSMSALRDAADMSVNEAKLIVALSQTWADQFPARQRLEEAIDELLADADPATASAVTEPCSEAEIRRRRGKCDFV